jgi:hypothetical protein
MVRMLCVPCSFASSADVYAVLSTAAQFIARSRLFVLAAGHGSSWPTADNTESSLANLATD